MATKASLSIVGWICLLQLTVDFLCEEPLSIWSTREKQRTLLGDLSQKSEGDVQRTPAFCAQASRMIEVPPTPSDSVADPNGASGPTPNDGHALAEVAAEAAPLASYKIPRAGSHGPSTRRSSFVQTEAMVETVRGRLASLSESFASMAEWAATATARQKASSGAATFKEKPAESVTIALAMLVTICIMAQAVASKEEELLKRKVSDERNALESAIDELLSDMERIAVQIFESAAYFAENNFDSKRRDFVSYLRQANDEDQLQSPGLKKPFRRFVEQWLNAFAECSLEPIESPIQVVSKEELDECDDASKMARLLAKRLESTRVDFLSTLEKLSDQEGAVSASALTSAASRDGTKAKALANFPAAAGRLKRRPVRKKVWSNLSSWLAVGRGFGFSFSQAAPDDEGTKSGGFPFVVACCCVRLSVLSVKHAFLLAVPWCCAGSFAWNCMHCSAPFAALALLVLAGSVFVLLRVGDDIANLELQIEQLHEAKDAAETRRDEVERFYGRLENVTSLWVHRTLPHLDILTEVHHESRDLSAERLCEFYKTCNTALEKVRLALGPLEIWCGAKMLHEVQLVAVAGQLTDRIGSFAIKKNMGKKKTAKQIRDFVAKIEGWDDKKKAKQCFACSKHFSLVVRRHRCKGCGRVACRSCLSQTRSVPKLGFVDPVRVCDLCVKQLDLEAIEAAEKLVTQAAMPELLSKVTLLSFLSVTAEEMLRTSNGELGDFSNTYVRLRVADTSWVRSDALQANAPPTWKADFFFPVRTNDKVLMIELVRESRGWSEVLGSADVRFRDLSMNERHSLKITFAAGPVAPRRSLAASPQGILAISLQFAADAWHLGDC